MRRKFKDYNSCRQSRYLGQKLWKPSNIIYMYTYNIRNKISFFELHWDINLQLVCDQLQVYIPMQLKKPSGVIGFDHVFPVFTKYSTIA